MTRASPAPGSRRLAVYTVLYPAALKYFDGFWGGLNPQLAPGFDAFFSLDGVTEDEVTVLMSAHEQHAPSGASPEVHLLPAADGASPAELRTTALAQLTAEYDGVILIDVDDVLLPGRLTAAAAGLETADVHACAMQIVDEACEPVPGAMFTLAPAQVESLPSEPELFARINAFGFGNAAYRSEVLAACLPVPPETVMMDWLVASRAYLAGAAFSFDQEPRMLYRQYATNTASVLPPFSPERITHDARRVAQHHALLLDGPLPAARSAAPFERARELSTGFLAWLEGGPGTERAAEYAARLATVERRAWLWWEHVAAMPYDGAYLPPYYL